MFTYLLIKVLVLCTQYIIHGYTGTDSILHNSHATQGDKQVIKMLTLKKHKLKMSDYKYG